nr:hypothetical protein [Bacteroidota bacterium]
MIATKSHIAEKVFLHSATRRITPLTFLIGMPLAVLEILRQKSFGQNSRTGISNKNSPNL